MNPLNNILPQVPEIRQVLEAPQVRGALTSLLGNGYIMHPHRHCHPNYPRQLDGEDDGERGQHLIMPIHKDGHAGGPRPRHRNPRWAILFYYPQECPDELGPTCIMPGTQHLHHLSSDGEKQREFRATSHVEDGLYALQDHFATPEALTLSGPLGRVWIMHFDVGHSVVENVLDKVRWGMKFVFMRTEEPGRPSWDSSGSGWSPPKSRYVTEDRGLLWTCLWNWMRGADDLFATAREVDGDAAAMRKALADGDASERLHAANELGFLRAGAADAVPDLVTALADDYEPVRVTASYALGAVGTTAVGSLVDAMQDAGEAEFYEENPTLHISLATHGLAAMGAPAIPRLVELLASEIDHVRANAAYALGEMGRRAEGAVEALIRLIGDPVESVARHAVSAVGMIGEPSARIAEAIAEAYGSAEDQSLRSYMKACVRLGPKAEAAIPTLEKATLDDFEYVRAFAVEALGRIDTDDAIRAMVPFLRTMRWFPYEPRKR